MADTYEVCPHCECEVLLIETLLESNLIKIIMK